MRSMGHSAYSRGYKILWKLQDPGGGEHLLNMNAHGSKTTR